MECNGSDSPQKNTIDVLLDFVYRNAEEDVQDRLEDNEMVIITNVSIVLVETGFENVMKCWQKT